MDLAYLLRIVFNGLRFSEFSVLRTSDTDACLLHSCQCRFDVTHVGGLQCGQISCLWLKNEEDVMKEFNSGKKN
jgi:hypothetical protein